MDDRYPCFVIGLKHPTHPTSNIRQSSSTKNVNLQLTTGSFYHKKIHVQPHHLTVSTDSFTSGNLPSFDFSVAFIPPQLPSEGIRSASKASSSWKQTHQKWPLFVGWERTVQCLSTFRVDKVFCRNVFLMFIILCCSFMHFLVCGLMLQMTASK